jgi:hypothetical protein
MPPTARLNSAPLGPEDASEKLPKVSLIGQISALELCAAPPTGMSLHCVLMTPPILHPLILPFVSRTGVPVLQ